MWGKAVAVATMIGSVALVAYHHRDDLLPSEAGPPVDPAEAAFLECMDKRGGDIDAMVADGVIGEDQATLFKTRAEAMCRATTAE
jgi:hypothetical protein